MEEMTQEQRKAYEEKLKNMSPEELKQFQKQQCIFCQIIAGKIPSKKVYEDDRCIAILDINPAAKGHILLLPKEHYAIMPQVPEKEIGHLNIVSKYLSQIVLKVLRCSGTNVFIANGFAAGQKAQHFMMHLIPRKDGDNLLQIQEKLIQRDMQEKVKGAVLNRLNAVLGVKTTIPPPEKKIEEKPQEPNVPSRQDPPKEEQQSPPFSVSPQPAQRPSPSSTSLEKKKKKTSKKKEPQEESDNEEQDKENSKRNQQEQKNERVSLDDIANLFK